MTFTLAVNRPYPWNLQSLKAHQFARRVWRFLRYGPAHRPDTKRSCLHGIDASSGAGLSFRIDLPGAAQLPAALMPGCSAGNRASRKGRENSSEGSTFFQTLQKTQALPGFASSLGAPPEPRPVHGPQGPPKGGGPNRQGGRKWKRRESRSPSASRAATRTVKVWETCPGSPAASR